MYINKNCIKICCVNLNTYAYVETDSGKQLCFMLCIDGNSSAPEGVAIRHKNQWSTVQSPVDPLRPSPALHVCNADTKVF
jgi:hypothetical protein